MSAWIGPLGSLIEFKCPSAVESSSEDPHVYFRPLGGDVSVTRLGDGTRPRVWDVSVSAAFPHHVAALEGLSIGEWGPGPFVFIPPAADTKNLLGRRDSMAMTAPGDGFGYVAERPGTPILTSEGMAGAGYVASTATPGWLALGMAPVREDRPVTGRAWVQALAGTTARLQTRFYSAGKTWLGDGPTMSTTETTGAFLHSTATPLAGAAYMVLYAAGAIITRPSVTWTAEPRAWSPSAASTNTVISPLSAAVRRATGRLGEETITDHRFTVTELRA